MPGSFQGKEVVELNKNGLITLLTYLYLLRYLTCTKLGKLLYFLKESQFRSNWSPSSTTAVKCTMNTDRNNLINDSETIP